MVKRMNNKGQALVTFVLVLPLILIVLTLVIDFGMLSVKKRSASNNIKSSIEYGLRHMDEENLEEVIKKLIYMNIDEDNIKKLDIDIKDNYITVTINLKFKSLFGILNRNNQFIISYTGMMEQNKIKVIKR